MGNNVNDKKKKIFNLCYNSFPFQEDGKMMPTVYLTLKLALKHLWSELFVTLMK